MSKQFSITEQFNGFRTKTDKTKLAPGFLVEGSQNVISTDGDNIKPREGYTRDGQANTSLSPIESSYDWNTHNGVSRNLRSYDDELEVRHVASDGAVTWNRVANLWSDVGFNFAEYWDTDESEDILLFVNGDANIYAWSGAVAGVDITNSTANTIKLADATSSWAEERFISDGTNYDKKLNINGTEYTYTGGESTNTLTGVTPDPTAGGHSDDDLAIQSVTTLTNKPASNVKNDLIEVLSNQVWVGSTTNRQIFVSAVNDLSDYTFSSPRLPGEGALLTLDGTPTAFIVQEENMYISAGKDQWYQSSFQLSSDFTKETIFVKRLKTDFQSAAQAQAMVTKMKNYIVFVSFEPTIDTLGRVESIDTPQSVPMSDPIKPTLSGYDLTGAHAKYFKNNYYLAIPEENILLIYNIEKGFWEAPQVLPAGRLSIIDSDLYLHSNSVPETYKLFDGYNDNGAPVEAIAKFSYMNFGDRVSKKIFDEWFSEGYIEINTDLNVSLNYDFDGYSEIKEFDIEGDKENFIFRVTSDSSLGKQSLGKEPLGTQGSSISYLPKFRHIKESKATDFFEVQPIYSSNKIDARWELLCFGANVKMSTSQPVEIKE